jgi:predicted metal-dependent enzyme (double-stranded beta helix superfamily)
MFDIDEFVNDCLAARRTIEPRILVHDVLARAVSKPAKIAEALQPDESGMSLLHHSPELTILHGVFAPRMSFYPHDHRMWAVIGIYAGREDNRFYRRTAPGTRTLEEVGGKSLTTGSVLILGERAIHAVANPLDRLTAAIHIYGGDFVNTAKSQWGPGPQVERPYDLDETHRQFASANQTRRHLAG